MLLLLRSWSPPQRAVEFVWVITCRAGVRFLASLLAVVQKSVGTTMAAAMAAITLLLSPYATKRVVGFLLRVKECRTACFSRCVCGCMAGVLGKGITTTIGWWLPPSAATGHHKKLKITTIRWWLPPPTAMSGSGVLVL
ncbi:unnamed protein product [Lactuca saligna]|uniref:Uncharacterized protein n=1 Tax=Lactuca saligna TaxID=75948 RepID=A0AA35VFV9_LACSI|nr:unnamed protein product [Lactuca saligna]